jgi:hypothetical protein
MNELPEVLPPSPLGGRVGRGGERPGALPKGGAHSVALFAQRTRHNLHAPSPYPRPQGRGNVLQ